MAHIEKEMTGSDYDIDTTELLLLVPGVERDDIKLYMDEESIHMEISNEDKYPYLEKFYLEIPILSFWNIKKISAYLQRGILHVVIPFIEGFRGIWDINIHIEEL